MATPVQDVYDFFLRKVTDYSFIDLNEDGVLEDVLYGYLVSSIVRFTNSNKDLSINKENMQFNSDLELDEIEILSTIMLLIYTNGKIMNVKNMEQILSEREFKMYSQANHLREMLSLKESIQSDISNLLTSYSLKNGLDELA